MSIFKSLKDKAFNHKMTDKLIKKFNKAKDSRSINGDTLLEYIQTVNSATVAKQTTLIVCDVPGRYEMYITNDLNLRIMIYLFADIDISDKSSTLSNSLKSMIKVSYSKQVKDLYNPYKRDTIVGELTYNDAIDKKKIRGCQIHYSAEAFTDNIIDIICTCAIESLKSLEW